MRSLRAALPETHITLIGLPWARHFVERFGEYLDEFIEFPGFPGFLEQPARIEQLPRFLSDIQQRRFDLALQMQGSGGISNPLIMLFCAGAQAGFYLPGQLAVIHPGAPASDRRWPAEWYAVVADGLASLGLQVVLTGTGEEAHLTSAVAARMQAPAVDLAGKTSLGTLGVLLSEARLFVCNDTGISHLASALQAPSIVLFTASDPERWAPLNRQLHRVVAWATAATPKVVLDEAESLLEMERVYAS
jgi:ADP-heptose:LPS heptosyltransferase